MERLDFVSRTETSVTLKRINPAAGAASVDVIYGDRTEAFLGPFPLLTVVPNGAGEFTLTGLVPNTRYYFQARDRAANGDVTAFAQPLAVTTAVPADPPALVPGNFLSPAIIVVPQQLRDAGGDIVDTHPAANMLTDAPIEQAWVDMGVGGSIIFETASEEFDTVAVLETNAPRGCQVTIETAATAGGAATFTYGPVDFHGGAYRRRNARASGLFSLGETRTDRFVRIIFSGTEPPGGVLVATYAVIGAARAVKNMAADKQETALDLGSLTRSRDGTPDRAHGMRGREVEVEIALMTEAQYEEVYADLPRLVGQVEPVLLVPNSKAGQYLQDRMLYGPLSRQRTTQPYSGRFTFAVTCDSII